jgi:hypothetical protein
MGAGADIVTPAPESPYAPDGFEGRRTNRTVGVKVNGLDKDE